MRLIDMTDKEFGRWRVIGGSESRDGMLYWHCRCACGTERVVQGTRLRRGRSTSCGCLMREEATRHGHMTGAGPTATYTSWAGMISRCTNAKERAYPDYGGRGITVCDRWRSFEAFLADMGEKPPGTSIDRIDNDGPYEPGNCRWATRKTQNRNKRSNHLLTLDGATRSLAEWAERLGFPHGLIHGRLNAGWSVERALTAPVRRSQERHQILSATRPRNFSDH